MTGVLQAASPEDTASTFRDNLPNHRPSDCPIRVYRHHGAVHGQPMGLAAFGKSEPVVHRDWTSGRLRRQDSAVPV